MLISKSFVGLPSRCHLLANFFWGSLLRTFLFVHSASEVLVIIHDFEYLWTKYRPCPGGPCILGCSMFVGDTWSSTLFDRCFGNSHMTSYAIFDLYFVTGSSLNTWHRFPHFFILWPWIIRKFIKTCLFFTFLLSHFFFNAFWRCYDNDNLRDNLPSTWHDCKRPRACFSQKNRAKVNPKVNL